MSDASGDTLAGFTIAITTDRRRDEFATMLGQHGARVVLSPALRVVPLADDTRLRAATRALLDDPPHVVVASTGTGMRGWLHAADGWGQRDALRERITRAYIVARSPGVKGALRAAGFAAAWSPGSESHGELVDHLVRRSGAVANGQRSLCGQRVAVQLHGDPQEELCGALVAAGADLIEVPVYRWVPPSDPTPLHRLIDLITSRLVDAVVFTSAPAVTALLRTAGPRSASVLTALRGDVLAAGLGSTAAAALRRHGVSVLTPARSDPLRPDLTRSDLDELRLILAGELAQRTRTIHIGGSELVLRGHAAVVDGELKALPPAQMAVLRALAAAPGRVLPRTELLGALPRGAEGHAVEMAVARLRAALGRPTLIQTVVKRGYRLRVD